MAITLTAAPHCLVGDSAAYEKIISTQENVQIYWQGQQDPRKPRR